MKTAKLSLRAITIHCLAIGLLAGCSTTPQTMYHWGGYEAQLYKMYSEPGQALPRQQLEELEAQVQQARAANRPLPPGYHAHLAYLYFQEGKADQARQELETEKSLYPEATLYMDRLLQRLQAPAKPAQQQLQGQAAIQTVQETAQSSQGRAAPPSKPRAGKLTP